MLELPQLGAWLRSRPLPLTTATGQIRDVTTIGMWVNSRPSARLPENAHRRGHPRLGSQNRWPIRWVPAQTVDDAVAQERRVGPCPGAHAHPPSIEDPGGSRARTPTTQVPPLHPQGPQIPDTFRQGNSLTPEMKIRGQLGRRLAIPDDQRAPLVAARFRQHPQPRRCSDPGLTR